MCEDDAAVGNLEREMYVLLNDQDSGSVIVGEAANDRKKTLHDHGGKAQAELIQQ